MDEEDRKIMIDELNNNVNKKNSIQIKKERKELSQIEKFKQTFYDLHSRMPTVEETTKNMKFIKNDDDIESSSTGKSDINIMVENELNDIDICNDNYENVSNEVTIV